MLDLQNWQQQYYTVAEVAKMLNVTQGRVRQYVSAKDLAAAKVGCTLLIPKEAAHGFKPRAPGSPGHRKVAGG